MPEPARCPSLACLFFVIAVNGCTSAPTSSSRPTDDDGGEDGGTDTETSFVLPECSFLEDQLPSWRLDWAKRFGSSGKDISQDLVGTGSDTFAITGWFCGDVAFDDTTICGFTGHMYLAKLDLSGRVDWAVSAGYG